MSDWYMGELAATDGYMPPDMPPDEERAPLRIEVRPPTAEAAQPELPPMAPLQPTGGLLPKQVPGSFSPAAMPTEERPSAFMRAMPKVYDPLQKQQQEVANLAYSLTPPGAVSDIVEAYQNKDPAGLLLGVAGGVPGAGTAAKLAAPAVKAALRHPTAVMGGLAALGTAASSDPAEASFLKAPSGKLLEKAKKLLSEGIGVQGIWDQTGLFQGKDGIWRYEVPDLGSKWLTDPMKLVGEKNLQLGDVFRHDKLFPKAPWLPETKLTVTREHPDIGGGFLRRDPAQGRPQNEIEVNVDYAHDTPHSVIMHEGTHVTQFEQALNAGTNINTKPLSKPAQSIYEQIKSDFMNPPTAKEAKAQGIIKPGYPYKQFMKEYEMVKNADPAKRDAYFRRLAADKAYTRSAGENEAGNVQFRANKEQDYLDTMPPPSTEGVPREQQIVTYNEQPQQPRLPGMLMGGLAEQPQLAIKAPTGFAPGSIADQSTYGMGHNKPPMEGLDFWADNPDPKAVARSLILPGDTRVSTRFPKAVQPTLSDPQGFIQKENPLKTHLSVGLEDMLKHATPEQMKHNMALLAEYPGFAHLKDMTPAQAARAYVDQTKGNLNHIWQNAPKIMQQRSPLWYEGANEFADALAGRYGVPRPSASGGVAVLSPQKDWFQNASLGERVGDIVTGASRKWDSRMRDYARSSDAFQTEDNWPIFKRIAGKNLDQLEDPIERAMWVRLYDEVKNPRHYREITPEGKLGDFVRNEDGSPAKVAWGSNNEIAKAIQMFESGGDMDTISRLLGSKHKVRSFYNNIENPMDIRFGDVTSDTHQVAGGQLRPLSGNTPEVAHNFGSGLAKDYQPPGYKGTKNSAVTGLQGTYPLQVAATQELGKDLGMIPRAVQSGVWEPVRTLFTDTFKSNPKNVEAIDNIWRAYDRKEITLDEARRAVVERAGGFEQPSWARSGTSVHDPKKASTYR